MSKYLYLSFYKHRVAAALVWLANRTIKSKDTPSHWPYYRAVDTKKLMHLGTEHTCDAYSYEHLRSLVDQDGPDGFGATATIAWLLSEEGWQKIGPDNIDDVRRAFAMDGIDMDDNGKLEAQS